MPSYQEQPVGARVLGRLIRHVIPGRLRRRWLRWRWMSRPLPCDWWLQFEREFRAYCGSGTTRPRRPDIDR